MKIKNKSRSMVFILSLFVWLALTSFTDLQEIIAGIVVSLIVSTIGGHFLITTENSKNLLHRTIWFIKYIFVFSWELIKANFHVAYIVIHPLLPVRPGIVKVKTELKKDTAQTLLANSITLTPGTMTVDLNPDKGELYIHWIDIQSKDPKDVIENTINIPKKFEPILMEVFE